MRWLLLSACLFVGCDALFLTDCPASSEPALLLTIRDALTDAPLAFGVEVIVRDESFADTLSSCGGIACVLDPEEDTVQGPWERPGRYDISIRQKGYELWERSNVRVRAGDCGPQTVRLDAHLIPLDT